MKRGVFFIFAFSLFFSRLIFAGSSQENAAEIYFFHALKVKEEGRFLMAERLFRKAIEIKPENPDFHFELGNLYVEKNRLESARKEYEQAIMVSPTHVPARYNLGLVYRELGDMARAREEFRKVLENDPYHVKAQMQIGYTYQAENFIDEAREAFRKAEEMDVSDPEPKAALEDLAKYEQRLRNLSMSRSRLAMQEQSKKAFDLLYRDESLDPQALGSQNPKQAIAQAGMALIQEIMRRRSSADEK